MALSPAPIKTSIAERFFAATSWIQWFEGIYNLLKYVNVGTGNPTKAALKGSIYIRLDATTTTSRLWINTDGGTTWAFVTTSA